MTTQKHWIRGAGSAAVAGLACTAALLVQQRRLRELRLRLAEHEEADRSEQQRHGHLAHQQRLQWELLNRAMGDPDLAAVLDTFGGTIPPAKHRQFLFANALYTNALFAYRLGNITRSELFGHVRGTLQNPIVREYWEATRAARASLEETSIEAQIGRMVDRLIHELDEADTDEWWVVGDPPE